MMPFATEICVRLAAGVLVALLEDLPPEEPLDPEDAEDRVVVGA